MSGPACVTCGELYGRHRDDCAWVAMGKKNPGPLDLCRCGHNRRLHSTGPCRPPGPQPASACECTRFRERGYCSACFKVLDVNSTERHCQECTCKLVAIAAPEPAPAPVGRHTGAPLVPDPNAPDPDWVPTCGMYGCERDAVEGLPIKICCECWAPAAAQLREDIRGEVVPLQQRAAQSEARAKRAEEMEREERRASDELYKLSNTWQMNYHARAGLPPVPVSLASALTGLEPDALEVLARIAVRLQKGQKYYGKLDVQTDTRDFRKELREELEDAIVYTLIDEMKKERAK